MTDVMPDVQIGRYALRTFLLQNEELVSVNLGHYWTDGTCTAICRAVYPRHTHDVPDKDCTCGIYGLHTLKELRRQYHSAAAYLVTVIAAEGRTIVGDYGLRTAMARVVAYWTPGGSFHYDQAIEAAAARQFSQAQYYANLDRMVIDYRLSGYSAWEMPNVQSA